MTGKSRVVNITSLLDKRREHEQAGPEHAKWCAGPYAHTSPAMPETPELPDYSDMEVDGETYSYVS